MLRMPMRNGLVFDIKKYSTHDGPGIRTTVFFKGCPLRCLWCHNPEGQDPRPELVYRKSRCIGCGECVKNCSRTAISPSDSHVIISRERCVLCGDCSRSCPSDALSIAGKMMSAEDIMKEIEKDTAFYDESHGGVTFSGGEPLLQPDFLDALLTECKKRDINTAVDTCGCAPYETICRIRDRVDLFLYDIKIMDSKKHKKYTGYSNRQILANFRKLAEHGSNIVVSFPIIPSVNDDDENVARTAKLIRSLPNVSQVNLLPYHKAGIDKYKNMGKPYKLGQIQTPSSQHIQSIKKRMEALGMRVEVGGG